MTQYENYQAPQCDIIDIECDNSYLTNTSNGIDDWGSGNNYGF